MDLNARKERDVGNVGGGGGEVAVLGRGRGDWKFREKNWSNMTFFGQFLENY